MNVQIIDNVGFTKECKVYDTKIESIKDMTEKDLIMVCLNYIFQNNETLIGIPYTLYNKKLLLNALIIRDFKEFDGMKLIIDVKPAYYIYKLEFKYFLNSSRKQSLTYFATSEETFYEITCLIGTKYDLKKVTNFKQVYYLSDDDDPDDYRLKVIDNDDIIQENFWNTSFKNKENNIIVNFK